MPPLLNIRRFKGVRYYISEAEKAQNELAQADNFMLDSEGVLIQRPSWRHIVQGNTSATTAPGSNTETFLLTPFPNGINLEIFAAFAGRAWSTRTDTPFFEVAGGVNLDLTRDYDAAVFNGNIFTGCGRWSGGGNFQLFPGWPSGISDTVIAHKDRLWTCNTSSYQAYRIYFSEEGAATDGTAWPAINFLDVRTDSPNRAIVSYRDSVFVLKPDGIWVISTGGLPVNWSVRKLGDQGCLGGACVYNNIMYWVGEQGVFSYNGVQIERISDPIQQYFQESKYFYGPHSQILGFDGNLYMCMVKAPENRREYWIYNIAAKAWFRMVHNLGLNALGRMMVVPSRYGLSNEIVKPGVYFGGPLLTGTLSDRPHLFYLDPKKAYDETYQESTSTYDTWFETGFIDFDEPHRKKRVKFVTVEGEFWLLSIRYFDEEGREKFVTAPGGPFNPTANITMARVPGIGYCKAVKMNVQIMPMHEDDPVRVYGLRAEVEVKGRESDQVKGTYMQ